MEQGFRKRRGDASFLSTEGVAAEERGVGERDMDEAQRQEAIKSGSWPVVHAASMVQSGPGQACEARLARPGVLLAESRRPH